MSTVYHDVEKHIAILTLNHDDNQFDPKFILSILNELDKIETETNATTLVVYSSHDKIFSNGINLNWLIPIIKNNEISKAKDFFYLLNKLFIRILTYPLITIASINGHAFAGGAILCCAFDFRFMRSDRGFFCLPEIDLGIPFLPGMNALIKKAIPIHMVEYMEYTGFRLTSKECKKHNIIIQDYHIDVLLNKTIEFAKTINKNKNITKEIKIRLNSSIVKVINTEDISYIESGNFNIS